MYMQYKMLIHINTKKSGNKTANSTSLLLLYMWKCTRDLGLAKRLKSRNVCRGFSKCVSILDGKYRRQPLVEFDDIWNVRQWPSSQISESPLFSSIDLQPSAYVVDATFAKMQYMMDSLSALHFDDIFIGPCSTQYTQALLAATKDLKYPPGAVTISASTLESASTFDLMGRLRVDSPKTVLVYRVDASTSSLLRALPGKEMTSIKNAVLDAAKRLQPAIDGEVAVGLSLDFLSSLHDVRAFAVELICEFAARLCPRPDSPKPLFFRVTLPQLMEIQSPEQTADLVEWMVMHLHAAHADGRLPLEVDIAVRPSNHFGTAVAAGRLALKAGAVNIEGSLLGQGPYGGSCDVVALAGMLLSEGVVPNLRTTDLPALGDVFTFFTGLPVPANHPMVGPRTFSPPPSARGVGGLLGDSEAPLRGGSGGQPPFAQSPSSLIWEAWARDSNFMLDVSRASQVTETDVRFNLPVQSGRHPLSISEVDRAVDDKLRTEGGDKVESWSSLGWAGVAPIDPRDVGWRSELVHRHVPLSSVASRLMMAPPKLQGKELTPDEILESLVLGEVKDQQGGGRLSGLSALSGGLSVGQFALLDQIGNASFLLERHFGLVLPREMQIEFALINNSYRVLEGLEELSPLPGEVWAAFHRAYLFPGPLELLGVSIESNAKAFDKEQLEQPPSPRKRQLVFSVTDGQKSVTPTAGGRAPPRVIQTSSLSVSQPLSPSSQSSQAAAVPLDEFGQPMRGVALGEEALKSVRSALNRNRSKRLHQEGSLSPDPKDEITPGSVRVTADVALNGVRYRVTCEGSGSLDAFFKALGPLFEQPLELARYHQHALGQGAEADACCFIQVRVKPEDLPSPMKEKVFAEVGHMRMAKKQGEAGMADEFEHKPPELFIAKHGSGSVRVFGAAFDTNSSVSSMKAVVSAVNRLLNAQAVKPAQIVALEEKQQQGHHDLVEDFLSEFRMVRENENNLQRFLGC